MSEFGKILRAVGKVADGMERAREAGETDPLLIVDAMLGGDYVRQGSARDQWWELFGLEARPTNKAQLDVAWTAWVARNHPDKGAPEAAFRAMRARYEAERAKL